MPGRGSLQFGDLRKTYAGAAEVIDATFLGNGSVGMQVFSASGTTTATITGSILSANGGHGLTVGGSIGATAKVVLTGSTLADNSNAGALCNGVGTLTVGNNAIVRNPTGLYQAGICSFESMGNNVVRQNGAASIGTITPVGAM